MEPYYDKDGITIYHGDCLGALRQLPDESVNCCVTSPPYWGLRDYGCDEHMIRNALNRLCVWQRTETLRGEIRDHTEVLKLRERVAHLERALEEAK